jgi:purine-binding chemotaxis protein CheW
MKQLTGWTQSQEVDFQTLLQLQNALSSLAQVALAGAYITFQVGDQICALNVAHIWKVAPLSTIEPLAQVPDYICGVMESEGERIPVLDLRRRMQIEAKTPSGMEHVLLAHFGKLPGSRQRIAILVDCVHKLHSFAFDEITVLPATAGLVPANLAWGSVQRQQKRIVLLSLSRLFPRDLASMLADKVAGTGKPADRQSWFNQLCLAANFQAN